MIDKEMIFRLNSNIGKLFKILALYEEKEKGIISVKDVEVYVSSLIFKLEGFRLRFKIEDNEDFEDLLDILTAIKNHVSKEDIQPVIKRESFKCIDIIHNIVKKLENG